MLCKFNSLVCCKSKGHCTVFKNINAKCLISHEQLRFQSRNIVKLNERGLYHDIFPNNINEITNLLNSGPQTVYAGFDPTANSLHIGHLLVLINLIHWQRGGHNVICLIGGATGKIGDPSERLTERPALDSQTVNTNIEGITNNIKNIFRYHEKYFAYNLRNKLLPYRIVNNEDWYKNMSAIDFVGKVGRHFRMGTMLLKQSVQTRIKSEVGLSFAEFTYQIFQSYDWLYLLNQYNCRFQIGGSDQMGNLVAGHELIARVEKKSVYGFTLPLLTTEEGDKFGKSAGNALWLDTDKTSPFSIYQYLLRMKDDEVEKYLRLLTFKSLGEIKTIMSKHQAEPHKRIAQIQLAEDITMLIHGDEGLQAAKKASEAIYSKDITSLLNLSQKDVLDIFKGASVVKLLLEPGITTLTLAMKAKCFPTHDDALRIINAGGFYINHQRVKKVDEIITQSAHILPNYLSLLRVGKRNYYIVIWQT